MAAALLDLQTIELESTLRPMGANGAPQSADYNASTRENLMDLATITQAINGQLFPLLNSLLASAALPQTAPVGIQGCTVFSDTTDQTSLFYDADNSTSLTLADSLRILRSTVAGALTTVNTLSVQVQSLSTSLSMTGQTDLTSAISGMYSLIETLQNQIVSLQASTGGTTQSLQNIQSQSVSTVSIFPGATASVSIVWGSAFPDNTYSVGYSLNDDTDLLIIKGFTYLPNGSGISVRVKNTSPDTTVEGIVCVIARMAGGTTAPDGTYGSLVGPPGPTGSVTSASSLVLIDTSTGLPVTLSITNGALVYKI